MQSVLLAANRLPVPLPAGRPRRCGAPLVRILLLSCSTLASIFTSTAASAQGAQELRTLVFDAVPLAAVTAADGTATLQEIGSLPAGTGVVLGQWLDEHRPQGEGVTETPEETIKRLEALVHELEVNDGPYSAALPQQLEALGAALEASGDLEKAQEQYDRAMHVTRVNHGLFSEGQIPYIRRSIDNHLRRGNLYAADEQQRYMFYLNRKAHEGDSAALLPALESFAEWNIFAFNAPVAGPALSLSENEAAAGVDEALFRIERLLSAQSIYWSIAQILIDNFGMEDPRLPEAERRIAVTNYYFATTVAQNAEALNLSNSAVPVTASTNGIAPAPVLGNMGYRQGRDALERRRDYLLELQDASVEEQLRASLDVADWMLYFSRQRMKGIDAYEELRDAYAGKLQQQSLDAVLSPAYPDLLPSFIAAQWSREALGLPEDLPLQYKGHIDVEFNLNRFGKTTTINVLANSNPEATLVEQRLQRFLRRAQFRPRFDGDDLRSSDSLTVRYYYTW